MNGDCLGPNDFGWYEARGRLMKLLLYGCMSQDFKQRELRPGAATSVLKKESSGSFLLPPNALSFEERGSVRSWNTCPQSASFEITVTFGFTQMARYLYPQYE